MERRKRGHVDTYCPDSTASHTELKQELDPASGTVRWGVGEGRERVLKDNSVLEDSKALSSLLSSGRDMGLRAGLVGPSGARFRKE
jgi:hypothetical protein